MKKEISNKQKKVKIVNSQEIKRSTRKSEDLALMKSLLEAPKLFTEQGSDEHLDILSYKLQLMGGRELTLEEYISERLIEYRSRFYKDFYYGIADLYNLDRAVMDKYQKPQCAADFTIQFIYARFPINVLRTLRDKSPWTEIPGIRAHKLFQYLSPLASDQLDLFIDQAVQMMKKCKDLTEFKFKYSTAYKVYFQLDMFADTRIYHG